MAAAAMSLRFAVALAIAVLAVLPTASTAAREGKEYKVGGPAGWVVPPPEAKEAYYANWASGITFYVKDSLEFEYRNDSVFMVDKAGYYHCTGTPPGAMPRDGVKTYSLNKPGYAYFTSGDVDRCKMGERLMINVLPADQPPASPAAAWAPGPSANGHATAAGHYSVVKASSVHAAVVLAVAALAMAG